MKARFFPLLFLFFLILSSCDGTYVTKKVLDSHMFEFKHAGKKQKVLIELKEIKTTVRRNGFFRPGRTQKNVSFDYAIFASVASDNGLREVFMEPSSKDADLDEFMSKIQIKRSKDHKHVALGYKHKMMLAYHSFKKVCFVAYPLDSDALSQKSFKNLDFNSFNSPREALKLHLQDKQILLITEKQLYKILTQLPADDELNHELSFAIVNKNLFQNEEYLSGIIKHCKKDENWKKNALHNIKNAGSGMSTADYIKKLHLIGGMEEVVKEDEYQMKLFLANGNPEYFRTRLDDSEVIFPPKIKEQLKAELEKTLNKGMGMSSAQTTNFKEILEMSDMMGLSNPFGIFMEALSNQKCNGEKLHDFNNEFMFPSVILGEADKRQWIEYMIQNFGKLSSFDKSWDYDRLDEYLTCEQKRGLLLKYKKDIDTFDNMEIPDCE